MAITAKDRVHSYLGGGGNIPVVTNLIFKPSILMRKVKGLTLSTDFTGILSWQNNFDFGMSYRTNASISLLSSVRLGNFDVGYAYETPVQSVLTQRNLKTHEIFLRIHLDKKSEVNESASVPESIPAEEE